MKPIFQKVILGILACLISGMTCADPNGLGQTIQIYTHFSKIHAKPSWLLIVRDIDNGQNIPYIFDFERGDNFWLIFTFGKNYLITASRLTFNTPNHKKISNFCGLESNGRIIRGQSLYVTVSGKLTSNPDTYSCNVQSFQDSNFSIATPSNN
jgi:hypothetical protein